ncbi:DUF416 family protein, partial [Vibrio campbellii]
STLLHALLDRDDLLENAIEVSQQSVKTVAQLEEVQLDIEISNDNQKDNEAVCAEWDVQWAIFRPLKDAYQHDAELIRDLRDELKEEGVSNIG